ncbi:hypothetical protein E3V93_11605 [Microbacterium sp. 3H14]|uniref:hypothetical protein n=1 Tax=unclassified Microbacterium TaxID=2609290 RepID=UPI00106B62EE|nr:hypothetical protein [Microbacterium sp. 3H14]TFB17221.1 hypothetical protein E3V93_11605 [Microbacterium sp. 3H14]
MTPLVPVNVDITTSMVAVVTVLTALVIGLGTLARPSRATVTWGAAFGLGMLGAYLWLAGQQTTETRALLAAASALLLCFEPLVWIGLRMHFGRRARWWPVIAFLVIAPTLLVTTADNPWYLPSFHLVFLGSAVFGGLVAYELLRDRPAARDIVLPLVLASCGLVVVAVVSTVSALLSGGAAVGAQLSALRGMNAVGTVVVSTCAAFTLVLMVRVESKKSDVGDFVERARRRLRKAEAQNDFPWSVLDIRLDDPADLREASTGSAFAAIVDRFHQDIQEALPASADADRVEDGRAIVVIRGGDESVRHHLREILTRISVIDRETTMTGIRSSASIGWATASVVGFDFDLLVATAEQAAGRARAAGGDQWKRADAADLARVVTPVD